MFLELRLQVVLNDLINGLNLTIGLRMINRREVLLYAELTAEFSKFFAIELRSIIRNDLLRYVISAYYCLPYEVLDLLTGDRGQWFGFCQFYEIVDSDHSVLEGKSRCGQRTNDIYPPYCERPWWRHRNELFWMRPRDDGKALTLVALSRKSHGICPQGRPKISLSQYFVGK